MSDLTNVLSDVIQQLTQFSHHNGITDPNHAVNNSIEQLARLKNTLRFEAPKPETLGYYNDRWDRVLCGLAAAEVLTRYSINNNLPTDFAGKLERFTITLAAEMENDMLDLCAGDQLFKTAANL